MIIWLRFETKNVIITLFHSRTVTLDLAVHLRDAIRAVQQPHVLQIPDVCPSEL